jgi:hypothetical protein
MSDQGNANGLQAFATLEQFLTEDDWYPQRLESSYTLRSRYDGSNGQYTCYFTIRVEFEQFTCYVMPAFRVPEEQRSAVAEYLTRANYGLHIGNFEMDYSDGEVRYKSSLDFEGVPLTPELIRNAIYPAARTTDRYMPGMMKVIYGGLSPEEAIVEIEGE